MAYGKLIRVSTKHTTHLLLCVCLPDTIHSNNESIHVRIQFLYGNVLCLCESVVSIVVVHATFLYLALHNDDR